VYGYEELLESTYALLDSYGYEVLMSHKGTLPVDPENSALESCLEAVGRCDIFLGLILPRYGSGIEDKGDVSITHKEIVEAIALNKPRWFLVHEHVAVARQLLSPYRKKTKVGDKVTDVYPFEFDHELEFQKTSILSDLRVIDMFELAMRHDIPDLKDRRGNWVQHYGPDDDARLFVTAQFRRIHELEQKHLPKLKDSQAIRRRLEGGQ
jgi:hypothetical protein